MRHGLIIGVLLGVALGMAGCSTESPDPKFMAEMAKAIYPKDAPLGQDYDIVVTQKGDSIKLDNRTPREYTNAQVWLNQEYVRTLTEITIGNSIGTNRFELSKFYNRHAEAFPVGTLLTPDKRRLVVLAEIFDPVTGQRHRLLVRPTK